MNPDDVIGESEYSRKLSVPLDMNDEYISLALGDFTHDLSDEEIRFNASSLLRIHQDIDADDINLYCTDGVIILEGLVNNDDMKQFCSRICSLVPGVKEVINNLTT